MTKIIYKISEILNAYKDTDKNGFIMVGVEGKAKYLIPEICEMLILDKIICKDDRQKIFSNIVNFEDESFLCLLFELNEEVKFNLKKFEKFKTRYSNIFSIKDYLDSI